MRHLLLRASAASLAIVMAQSLAAQTEADPAAAPAPAAKPVGGKRVYTAADFARFAPKTAYDMLGQVPGFTIRSADAERGLGQASENVLINGQRVANKSGGAVAQLRQTGAANVDRTEIVEAASLGIAGLSGEVANVILRTSKKSSGAFEWASNWRAHFAKAEPVAGSISYSGSKGPLDYTVSVQNDYGRGGLGGPINIFDRERPALRRSHRLRRLSRSHPGAVLREAQPADRAAVQHFDQGFLLMQGLLQRAPIG